MGMQSFSLRGYDFPTALKHTKELGLKYWESIPNHIPLSTTPKNIHTPRPFWTKRESASWLTASSISTPTRSDARQKFDFAKAMGLVAFSANPRKDKKTFDLLDKLVAEYDVAIAIHNHGPHAATARFATWPTREGPSPEDRRLRRHGALPPSDEDPVEALEVLKDRLYGVHLKDVRTLTSGGRRQKIFTILGQGDLNIFKCLQILKRINYQGCLSLEYEENEKNPLSDIAISLQAVRDAAAKLG